MKGLCDRPAGANRRQIENGEAFSTHPFSMADRGPRRWALTGSLGRGLDRHRDHRP
jgi:hypothetical protein